MRSAEFDKAAAIVLRQEGGFTLDPNDDGNWTGGKEGVGELKGTNFGISAAKYPNLDIKNLTKQQALDIYERDYWREVRGDDLPYPVALVLFDIKVNGGHPISWLQQALGVTADGKLGPQTLGALQRADVKDLVGRILRRRVLYYTELKRWPEFKATWVQRAFDLHREALDAG